MEKRKVSWSEFQGLVANICRDIANSEWRPDYIVGITRGGLLPAVMISQYFNVPCEALKVSLRDNGGEHATESNLWMAEDAFNGKKILVVDDINDTGATVNWIIDDWCGSCVSDKRWEDVWNRNVRFATVFDNLASNAKIEMNYIGEEINKAERNIWIDFPFENWWTK
jgi:hypoxanthine-guanine phosphoribosyltransferase